MRDIPVTGELTALIQLLDEPDEKAYEVIARKIETFGREAIPGLIEALENSFIPGVRDRITILLDRIRQETFRQELQSWMEPGASDLLEGFLLMSKFQDPEIDTDALTVQVEQLKMDVWIELNDSLTALENVKVINHVLYGIHRFEGNRVNLYAISNQYLHTVMETRQGNPLTLGMLYMIIAQRLNIPIYGVNLPQHFILAYLRDDHPPVPEEQDVLFYINPFNRGAVFTRKEIDLFVRQMNLRPEPWFYTPCSHIDILRRLINNLILSYTQINRKDLVDELTRIQKMMSDLTIFP